MKLKILILFILLFNFQYCSAQTNYGVYTFQDNIIDASNNARYHNNLGNLYFEEKNYIGALKEYEIAYNLAYENNLSATYLYNIARCYITLGRFELAKKALLGVIKKDCLNLTYYEALVDCFINLNTQDSELEKYLKDNSNPYNKIVAGLIYYKTGEKRNAKILFDNFINENPALIINDDIKKILDTL